MCYLLRSLVRVYYWIYFYINECKFFVLTFNKILLLYSWVWLFQPSVVKFNSLIGLACWNVIADFLYHLYLKHHLNKHCFDINFVITVSVVLISVLGVKRITGEDCWLVRISLFFFDTEEQAKYYWNQKLQRKFLRSWHIATHAG